MRPGSQPQGNGTIEQRVEYFPGTLEPLPALLTPSEAARVLRLDVVTKPARGKQTATEDRRDLADALKSLDHLARRGLLKPRRFGKSRTYSRDDVLQLIADDEFNEGAEG